VFDALLSLDDFDRRSKVFATQIDFEKFFDKIPHVYLNKLIDSELLHTTTLEKRVLDAYMMHDSFEICGGVRKPLPKRDVGTPQGSSISLILSNLANHELDRQLSLLSGKFVRYADDVVALSTTYEQALAIEHAFYWHCEQNGLTVNKSKSPGISAFSDETQEIRTTKFIDFLGYRLTFAGKGISPSVETRFKQKVAKLINIYLIQYQKLGFNHSRASVGPIAYDWDLLGLVSELRRSIYGGLKEDDILQVLRKGKKISKMKGIMTHYCLLDDCSALERLDGWTLNAVRRAMVQRNIVIGKYGGSCPTPSNKQLLSGDWLNIKAWELKEGEETVMPEVKFPSFVKAWKAARKQIIHHGFGSTESDLNNSDEDLVDLFDYP
jgi:RNA-directed DNA polymerase